MATVIEIVKEKLQAMGADGLVCPEAECSCKLNDLAPCGGDFGKCRPGFISAPNDPVEYDWEMWPTKELADAANERAKNGGAA